MATVLVADDDAAVADMLRLGLTQHGYGVVTCHDGSSALDLLRHGSFDMLIMDVRMPGMDGLAVVRQIRGQPGFAKLRIMILSADSASGERQRALQSGADSYALKPFRILDVVQQVDALLQVAR